MKSERYGCVCALTWAAGTSGTRVNGQGSTQHLLSLVQTAVSFGSSAFSQTVPQNASSHPGSGAGRIGGPACPPGGSGGQTSSSRLLDGFSPNTATQCPAPSQAKSLSVNDSSQGVPHAASVQSGCAYASTRGPIEHSSSTVSNPPLLPGRECTDPQRVPGHAERGEPDRLRRERGRKARSSDDRRPDLQRLRIAAADLRDDGCRRHGRFRLSEMGPRGHQRWSGAHSLTPTLADVNNDATVELLVGAGSALNVWNLGYPTQSSTWPMFQRDYENSGTVPATNGLMQLRTPSTNQVLVLGTANISGWGDVTHNAPTGAASERFKLDRVGVRLFRIRQYVRDRCLFVDPASPGSVRHKACSVADATQIFELVSQGNGAFLFKNQGTGACLTSNGGNGGTVTTSACSSAVTGQIVQVERMQGENLALRAAVSAQSTYPYEGYSVQRIIDGSQSTALGGGASWANNTGTAGAPPQWVDFDFGAVRTFDRVDIYTTIGYSMKEYQKSGARPGRGGRRFFLATWSEGGGA